MVGSPGGAGSLRPVRLREFALGQSKLRSGTACRYTIIRRSGRANLLDLPTPAWSGCRLLVDQLRWKLRQRFLTKSGRELPSRVRQWASRS